MTRPVALIAVATAVLLAAFASGYGYHRDELYFIAAGDHLAWAYPDQGPITPLIARAMNEIAPDSLTVLRLPSALAAGVTVALTGALARELGGRPRAEWIAAACAAVAAIVLFTGHLLSTSTFDLPVWTAVTWLAVRAIRTGEDRLWVLAGAVLGVGLLNKPLPAFLALGILTGVAIAGPRRLLGNPYVWGGAALALAIWSPWLIWQADHGWPQIDVSRELAAGGSTSSEPRWAIVPFQALLAGPLLAPVWIAGLVHLFRDRSLRDLRFLAWAWVALVVVYTVLGGKPYYLAGLLPVLIAAGSVEVDAWLSRGRSVLRRVGFAGTVIVSAAVTAVVSLPVLPVRDADPAVALNEDVGETIGWPGLAETVARVYRAEPGREHAVILAWNYGEAGAIDRYGPALGLGGAYSGHNAYWEWGPPPEGSDPVIAVGQVEGPLRDCTKVARIANDAGIDNDEDGAPVSVCRAPLRPWSEVWPEFRRLG